MWGTLRDEDGTLYSTMRRIAPPVDGAEDDGRSSLGGKLIVVSSGTDRGPGLQIRKEPRYAVDSAKIGIELTDAHTATMTSAPDAEGQPMKLVLNKDDFHYVEEGVIDMSGRMVVNPLQWYLPGRDASLLYITPDLAGRGHDPWQARAGVPVLGGGVDVSRRPALPPEGTAARRRVHDVVLVGEPVGGRQLRGGPLPVRPARLSRRRHRAQ